MRELRRTRTERKQLEAVLNEVDRNTGLSEEEAWRKLRNVVLPRTERIAVSDLNKVIILNKFRPDMARRIKRVSHINALLTWGGLFGMFAFYSDIYLASWATSVVGIAIIQEATQVKRLDLDDYQLRLIKGR